MRCGRPVERFTDNAREVMVVANRRAIGLLSRTIPEHASAWWRYLLPQTPAIIKPRHILAAIALGPHGVGYGILVWCGVDPQEMADAIERRGTWGARFRFCDGERLMLSPFSHLLVQHAINEAFSLRQDWVGTEHLLLAMTRTSDGVARKALASRGVTAEKVTEFILRNAEAIAQHLRTVEKAITLPVPEQAKDERAE